MNEITFKNGRWLVGGKRGMEWSPYQINKLNSFITDNKILQEDEKQLRIDNKRVRVTSGGRSN